MAERNASRPWTEQEDALLREGVARYGEQDHWKNIAQSISGRTNKACRKRWLHSLSPSVKKCAWGLDEDSLLLKLYEENGPKWSLIARSIPGRTDDACSKRYREALDPSLKKDEWTPEEDQKLFQAYARIGNMWMKVGQELGRSSLGCRNRWRLLERKRVARANQEASGSRDTTSLPAPEASVVPTFATPDMRNDSPLPSVNMVWPPYYPPEMYPSLPDGDMRTIAFREPTPEVVSLSPHVAPFRSSSSSLSAALSAPPPRPRPLPPDIFYTSHFNHGHFLSHSQSQPASQTASPLFFDIQIIPSNDVTMSLGDYGLNMDHHDSNFTTDLSQASTGQNTHPLAFNDSLFHDPGVYTTVSPLSPSVLALPVDPLQFGEQWKSPHYSSLFAKNLQDHSPSFLQHSVSSISEPLDELSSTASTPFPLSASISPTSPNSDIQMDLPNLSDISSMAVSPTGGSLLFSVPSPQPQAPTRRRRKTIKRSKPESMIRLSSNLKLSTNPNVRPYVCGHEGCWPTQKEKSRSCFSTSKELFDHNRDDHTEGSCEKPFRCGLEGCGKSWKSINGLQYHLQISAAHFKNALQSRFSAQQQQSTAATSAMNDDTLHIILPGDPDADDTDRRHSCPHPDCFKAYRQPSGLRYHLKHGHPSEMPIQLPEVPPALERELPKKAKRMRLKSPEPMSVPIA